VQNPKVSIIIPTYRHRDFIRRTLDSVFAQTMRDYEVIVINDGSPDDTKSVLEPLIKANRIRYVEQENQGQSNARNRGIEMAKGEYIAFLDDDDLWPADKLGWQSNFLETNADAGLIGGVLQRIDENDHFMGKGNFHPLITFESLFAENPFLSPGQTLIRTKILKDLGMLSSEIWGADDWDLWFRISKKFKIIMKDRLALFYRLHPGNASKQIARLIEGSCVTLNIHLKDVPQGQRQMLRRKAHHMLYRGLGTLLVADSKKQLRRAKFFEAFKTLSGLQPLRQSIFLDPLLRRRFFNEMLFSPLKRRIDSLIPKKSSLFL